MSPITIQTARQQGGLLLNHIVAMTFNVAQCVIINVAQRMDAVPQLTPRMGTLVAVAILFAYFITPGHIDRDTRGQVEARVEGGALTLISLGRATAAPIVKNVAVKNVAPWFGLCPAYAATTVAGFKAQVMNDPQLLEQYKNFDWMNAAVVANPKDFYRSVAYKKNGQIHWSRKMLLIKKGEKILTDGRTLIRTYCCNQIALVPPGPFLPPRDEPPPEDLQPPEAPAIPDFPPIDIPPELITYVPPFTPPPPVVRRRLFGEKSSRRPPTSVPEPATFILLVSGLGVLALSFRRDRRRDAGRD